MKPSAETKLPVNLNLTNRIIGRRNSFSAGVSSRLGGFRSASQDIYYKPHEAHNFWSTMVSMQRTNQWNNQYSRSRDRSAGFGGAFGSHSVDIKEGNNRSSRSSVSRGGNNEGNFGIWGKQITNNKREASPAFGAARVRAIKEDYENTS